MQTVPFALRLLFQDGGITRAARTAIIKIIISSSSRVKPFGDLLIVMAGWTKEKMSRHAFPFCVLRFAASRESSPDQFGLVRNRNRRQHADASENEPAPVTTP